MYRLNSDPISDHDIPEVLKVLKMHFGDILLKVMDYGEYTKEQGQRVSIQHIFYDVGNTSKLTKEEKILLEQTRSFLDGYWYGIVFERDRHKNESK